ncbi:MAG: hypothetical protein JXR73_23425 [Candidatus Omnitrophica bacterium]|nr:hypothetical protein [Candidatus Omnitrophota bacterium]
MKYPRSLFSILILFIGALLIFISLEVISREDEKYPPPADIESASAPMNEFMEAPPERRGMPPGRMQGRGRGRGPGENDPTRIQPYGRGQGRQRGPEPFPPGDGWRSMMREHRDSPERMRQIRRENPQLADLMEKIQRLRYRIDTVAAQEGARKDDVELNRLKKRLLPLLEEEFDLEMQRQDMEIDLMQKRLQQLRDALQKRKNYRSRIIELKLEQILQGEPPLPEEAESAAIPSATEP